MIHPAPKDLRGREGVALARNSRAGAKDQPGRARTIASGKSLFGAASIGKEAQ